MNLNFRFGIIGDPHVGLPHTIWDHPSRFHLIEVSIPALEQVFSHLSEEDLDFLLLPGDLTQHGERENHEWLVEHLEHLPFPVYVVPGNHDIPHLEADAVRIGWRDFPLYYQKFGYENPDKIYYHRAILPGVRLIGLNSNSFDASGKPYGYLDADQFKWLQQELETIKTHFSQDLILVMIHHNVIEHLPNQANHPLGRRYMLDNARDLWAILNQAGVPLIFTGHLHVQDVAHQGSVYEITTGSLVSYPHPYRICQVQEDDQGRRSLQIESPRVKALPGWPDLLHTSREWMGDRSEQFMLRMLLHEPLHLPPAQAQALVPHLRYFWADIANGDAQFDFSQFPDPVRRYFQTFSAMDEAGNPTTIDNQTTLDF